MRTLIFRVFVPGTVAGLELFPLPLGSFPWPGLVLSVAGGLVYWCAWAFTWVGRGTPNPGDPPRELGVILVQTVLFQSGVLLG